MLPESDRAYLQSASHKAHQCSSMKVDGWKSQLRVLIKFAQEIFQMFV